MKKKTHQLRTLAFARCSSPFKVMLCCISSSISTMSVIYRGWSRLLQPLATVRPTIPPPAPSSNLREKKSQSVSNNTVPRTMRESG